LVKKELNGLTDLVTSEKYPKWRNLTLVTISMILGFEVETLQTIEPTKRKRINNEKELREQLEKLQIEVDTNKVLRISLDKQLLIKEKLRKFVEQQLEEKDKKIISLKKKLKEKKAVRN
jgi:L-fucose isomerase-like protein